MTPAERLATHGLTLIRDAARKHLLHYARLMHPIVSGETYINAVHCRAIAEALDKVVRGKIRRLIIAVPPRHFKSYFATVALPTYLLGLDPKIRIVCASYGADLAEFFAKQSLQIMQSPDYGLVFPKTRLRKKNPAVDQIFTTKNGYRIATSVQGAITGKGADVVIIDDPMKAGDASSAAVRDHVAEWFKTSILSRFDKPNDSRAIVVMQRLHQDDLIGRLKAEGGWTVLELPGEAMTSYSLDLGFGKKWKASPGGILFPERFDAAALKQLRHDLGEAGYAAQVLQKPTPAGGHLFDLTKAKRFNWSTAISNKQFEGTIVSVDCCSAGKASSDYTAITTWAVKGPRIYLLAASRGKWSLPTTVEKIKPILAAAASKMCLTLIETGGAGYPLKHTLDEQGYQNVRTWSPKNNKEARAEFANLKIEQGVIWLPFEAPWLEEIESELASFPHGKNDDYVDSFSQVIWNLEANMGNMMHLSSFPTKKLGH